MNLNVRACHIRQANIAPQWAVYGSSWYWARMHIKKLCAMHPKLNRLAERCVGGWTHRNWATCLTKRNIRCMQKWPILIIVIIHKMSYIWRWQVHKKKKTSQIRKLRLWILFVSRGSEWDTSRRKVMCVCVEGQLAISCTRGFMYGGLWHHDSDWYKHTAKRISLAECRFMGWWGSDLTNSFITILKK